MHELIKIVRHNRLATVLLAANFAMIAGAFLTDGTVLWLNLFAFMFLTYTTVAFGNRGSDD